MAKISAVPCLIVALVAALLCGQVLSQDEGAVAKEITLGDVKASVINGDGRTSFTDEGAYPAKLLQQQDLAGAQILEVSLSPKSGGAAFKPQQVMLLLSHKASGVSAYAVGKLKKDGSYTITTSVGSIEKQIGKQGGAFEVTLLVGDPSVPTAHRYPLGEVELPAGVAGASPPTVRTSQHQPLNNVKPEIEHLHRLSQKRPPAFVSLVFTGLTAVPLLGMLAALAAYGVNLKGFPSGTAGLFAILFHSVLIAFGGLYLLFWTQLNLMQTLPLALMLGVALFVSGHFALRGIASARLKKD